MCLMLKWDIFGVWGDVGRELMLLLWINIFFIYLFCSSFRVFFKDNFCKFGVIENIFGSCINF